MNVQDCKYIVKIDFNESLFFVFLLKFITKYKIKIWIQILMKI